MCYLLFDCEPQRGENLFNVAVHGSSFRQVQPQALLLLLTQADRRGKRPVSRRVAERLPNKPDRGHRTEGGNLSAGPQQC